MSVSIDRGWVNDGSGGRVPVWSGEFHYFRNERRYWPRILRAMKDAGLTMVTSFVQPNWHEYEPGKFDFEGRTAPERDLTHLLRLAKETGLYVQLRLGPACCEWRESGGTSFGTKWRDVSDAFWDAIGPYQVGNGGAMLLYQVHNEWSHPLGIYYILYPSVSGFDGFHAQPVPHWLELCGPNAHYLSAGYEFSMGYLPRYLASLYPDVQTMNAAWRTGYANFDAVSDELVRDGVESLHGFIAHCREAFRRLDFPGESPRRAIDLLDWANFYMAAPLSEDVDHTRTRTSLPVLHNWAMGDERRWSRMAHLDLSGYDMYAPMSVDIWQWNKNTYDMQTSPFPFSNEFMCGTIERYEWGGQGFYTEGFARMSILSYVMGGMKGANLYMFVERDNWLQCPLDERGGKRPCYDTISAMVRALKRTAWHEVKMARDLGVLKHTDYHCFADGSDDGMFDEGYREAYLKDGLYAGHSAKQQFVATFRALHDASIDFEVLKDTRGGESLGGLRAVLAYSLWFMERGTAEDLARFVEGGGRLVLFPCVPTHGDDGREMDVFTERLGLRPFAGKQDAGSHVKPGEVDLDSVMSGDAGDFTTASGRLWARARDHGAGRVLALNLQLANSPELLRKVVMDWCGCRRFVDTMLPLTDGGMGIRPDGHAVIAAVNGGYEGQVREIAIDISELPSSEAYAITDELSEELLGNLAPVGNVVRVPVNLGPRDGMLLSVVPGRAEATKKQAPAPEVVGISGWHARREHEAFYHHRYLGTDIGDAWAPTPLADWTLPAIASGKVYGVQGWFYLKQSVELPASAGRTYLHIRPNGYHNLGIVYLNGAECGSFMIERPGAESLFDVTALVRPGEPNTLAIRLYRQSLDCHDRGSSGFDMLRFQCEAGTVEVDHLHLRQERRDQGEIGGWAAPGVSEPDWEPASLPLELTMRRQGDALWMKGTVDLPEGSASVRLRLSGKNCVVSVFVNGEYAVKSPMLPCELNLSDFTEPGTNTIALRIAPDNFEHYLLPRDKRYESYIRDGLLPLEVRLEGAEVVLNSSEV